MRFRYGLLFICFGYFSAASAQEICTNGIDDDADGLIDLNDSVDCACNGLPMLAEGVITNPSFETGDCIPMNYGQLDCAENWASFNFYDADYFHLEGYMPEWIQQPLPANGHACVGGYALQDYKEYIGTCLTIPLVSGNTYQLRVAISASMVDNALDDTSNMGLSPIEITIFGWSDCSTWPTGGYGCPSEQGWTELGHTSYLPTTAWSEVTITFTPASSIEAITIGSPCSLPPDYPIIFDPWLSYFLFDDLLLMVNGGLGLPMESFGSLCQAGVLLVAHPPDSSGAFQWFHDGVAVPGATDSVYLVTDLVDGPGQYQFMVYGDTTCAGGIYTVAPPVIPTPTILEIQGVLFCDETGAYQWYFNGEAITGATAQSITPDANGEYQVEVTNGSGCVGLSEPFNVIDVGVAPRNAGQQGVGITALPGSIEVTGAKGPLEFRLFAPSGQCMARAITTGDRWRYDLSTLPSGVYIAWVEGLAVRVVR